MHVYECKILSLISLQIIKFMTAKLIIVLTVFTCGLIVFHCFGYIKSVYQFSKLCPVPCSWSVSSLRITREVVSYSRLVYIVKWVGTVQYWWYLGRRVGSLSLLFVIINHISIPFRSDQSKSPTLYTVIKLLASQSICEVIVGIIPFDAICKMIIINQILLQYL